MHSFEICGKCSVQAKIRVHNALLLVWGLLSNHYWKRLHALASTKINIWSLQSTLCAHLTREVIALTMDVNHSHLHHGCFLLSGNTAAGMWLGTRNVSCTYPFSTEHKCRVCLKTFSMWTMLITTSSNCLILISSYSLSTFMISTLSFFFHVQIHSWGDIS